MKKVILVTGVAVLALASVAGAYSFATNLTVGSRGADVTALQSALIAGGYSIPAGATGYFGSQTKAAVQAFQAKNNVPATGFVGPLTRGVLNGGTSLPSVSTVTVPGTSAVSGVTAGTDGSVTVSQSSFVSSGQSIKKGETKNVVAVKLQATAGAVAVTRFDVHFNYRPWLYFSQITLTDSSGKVLATKPIMSAADATEITVGSDYLVRFTDLNYVVAPGVNPDLAVGVTVLPATDKITNGMIVVATIPAGAIRTVNGIGVSDSVGGAGTVGNSGYSSFTLTSTGSVADIATRVSPVAPASQVSQVVSATVQTSNVPLGIFSLKSQNNSATVQALNVQINTNPNFGAVTQLFSNIRLVDGATTYGALSLSSGGLATFTNLNIALTQDQWKDLKVLADVAATGTDVLASSTLVASSISAIDSTYTTATIAGSNQTSANTLFTINSVSVSNTSAVAGAGITDAANGPVQRYPVAYSFTLANNSSNSLYVSANVGTFIGTTTSPTNASSTITLINPMDPVSGDVTGTAYIIPAGGSRTFTVSGIIKKSSNSSAAESLSINAINYGTTSAGTGSSITAGLTQLYKLVNF